MKRKVKGDAWLRQAATSLIDHSPFRYRIIQIRNLIFTKGAKWLFPIPVNPGHPEVSAGKDGWLFLLNETPSHRSKRECQAIAEQSVDLARLVEKSGRKFYFAPFPDKVSIYPEYNGYVKKWAERRGNRPVLPPSFATAWANAQDMRGGFISIWQPMIQAKAQGGESLYWDKDTHWNHAGITVAAHALIDGIQPGLFETQSVVRDGYSNGFVVGGGQDLSTVFLLQPDESVAPQFVIQRAEGDRGKVVKGNTLIIGDSFAASAFPMIRPWFENMDFGSHDIMGTPEMGALIEKSDTVIWTSVERFVPLRLQIWAAEQRAFLKTHLTSKEPIP